MLESILFKYKMIFVDILGESFKCEKIENENMLLRDKNNNKIVVNIIKNYVYCRYEDDNIERRIFFEMLDREDNLSDVTVVEIKEENGTIEEIERVYSFLVGKLCDLLYKKYAVLMPRDYTLEDFLKIKYIEKKDRFKPLYEKHTSYYQVSQRDAEILDALANKYLDTFPSFMGMKRYRHYQK